MIQRTRATPQVTRNGPIRRARFVRNRLAKLFDFRGRKWLGPDGRLGEHLADRVHRAADGRKVGLTQSLCRGVDLSLCKLKLRHRILQRRADVDIGNRPSQRLCGGDGALQAGLHGRERRFCLGIDVLPFQSFVGGQHRRPDFQGHAVKRDNAPNLSRQGIVIQKRADRLNDARLKLITRQRIVGGDVKLDDAAIRHAALGRVELRKLAAFGYALVHHEQQMFRSQLRRCRAGDQQKEDHHDATAGQAFHCAMFRARLGKVKPNWLRYDQATSEHP